jgi:hypothetical protein
LVRALLGRLCTGRVLLCLVALGQRVQRRRAHGHERDQADPEDHQKPAVAPACGLAFARDGSSRVEVRPPCEHGIGEDIVEDLVGGIGATAVNWTQDPLARGVLSTIAISACGTPRIRPDRALHAAIFCADGVTSWLEDPSGDHLLVGGQGVERARSRNALTIFRGHRRQASKLFRRTAEPARARPPRLAA